MDKISTASINNETILQLLSDHPDGLTAKEIRYKMKMPELQQTLLQIFKTNQDLPDRRRKIPWISGKPASRTAITSSRSLRR